VNLHHKINQEQQLISTIYYLCLGFDIVHLDMPEIFHIMMR